MPLEIERKFLVDKTKWTAPAEGTTVRQGYLPGEGSPLLVRIRRQNEKAFLTLKGRNNGITRAEYEYEIPAAEADELLTLCKRPLIEKTRYLIPFDGHTWEVDVFAGENEGLILAEIELQDENESFVKPDWLGQEVSADSRYYNSNLAENPYADWR